MIRGGDTELSVPGESGDGRAISFSRLGSKAAKIPGHPTQGSLAQGQGVCVCAHARAYLGVSEGQALGNRLVGGKQLWGSFIRILRSGQCPLIQVSEPWKCQP